jgi:processive 1,2-diacylglycerol beta-glucosyltransferase
VAGQAQPGNAGLSAPRVLILTASIGAGHDLPAEVLAAELRERAPGAHVTVADALHEAGPLIERLILGGSLFGSRAANLAFDVEHWLLARAPLLHRAAGRLTVWLIGRRMLALVARECPDVVVSTYPGSTEVFGRLRRAGRLGVPVVAAITDLASLRFWAHAGIDLHLVTHPESADEVRSIAGRRAEVVTVRGFNDPAFAVPLDRADARRALDLPGDRQLVVVSGGGWGVGDLEGALATVLERTGADALVLCGNNDALRERLAERFATAGERVRIWGFTDRMPELLAAADALVHSTAGLTVLEAIVRGCPPISYGWGHGHIRVNNRAYARLGLADVARDRNELRAAIGRALAARPQPDASFAALPTAAAVVLERFGGLRDGQHVADLT